VTLRHFALPDLGEGLTEADILGWLVAEGDEVRLNQPIVEVETAKAAVEVPSPWAGRVTELYVRQGQTVAVGATIISIETVSPAHTSNGDHHAPDAGGQSMLVGYGPRPAGVRRRRRIEALVEPTDISVLAKPPVRKLARDLGVDLRDVRGSGPAGSITRDDVGAAGSSVTSGHPAGSRQVPSAPEVEVPGENRVPLTGLRKAMASAMTESAFSAPHATVFLTVDATETVALRGALDGQPGFDATPITPLAVTAKAVCIAARRAPLMNSRLDEEAGEVVLIGPINLGIAVATPRGLLVPNIKDAGRLSLQQLSGAIRELSVTARDGHTRAPDLADGTICITNIGVFGVDGGTPILNPGESAILCLGTVRPTPWVHEGAIAIREVVQLSLSFDHRVIDGQVASQFLADVGAMLTDPRLLLARA
jgi:2-oxoisovalerate dehydrogenase E2 component (dihydrolipoyl transacylase)